MSGEVMLTCHIKFQSDKFTRGQWGCRYCSRHSNTLPTRGLVMEINATVHENICFLLKRSCTWTITTWKWHPPQQQLFHLDGMYLLYSWVQYPVEFCAPTPSCSPGPPRHVQQREVACAGSYQLCRGHTHWVVVNMLPWQLPFTHQGTKMFCISLYYTNRQEEASDWLKFWPQPQYIWLDLLCRGRERKHRWSFRIFVSWMRRFGRKEPLALFLSGKTHICVEPKISLQMNVTIFQQVSGKRWVEFWCKIKWNLLNKR